MINGNDCIAELDAKIEYLGSILKKSQDTYFYPYSMEYRLSANSHFAIWDDMFELIKTKNRIREMMT